MKTQPPRTGAAERRELQPPPFARTRNADLLADSECGGGVLPQVDRPRAREGLAAGEHQHVVADDIGAADRHRGEE